MAEKFVFFWGKGDYLSQWYASSFSDNYFMYRTAEHYMMAQKAILFGDRSSMIKIAMASSPREAKKLGREVSGFNSAVWDNEKTDIVFQGNLYKFQQNHDIQEKLLNTGDATLVEASPFDKIWGIGLDKHDNRAAHPEQWLGQNLLGKILMDVRTELRR